ncbi:hypothetical protein DICPUDRAFT_158419 [Dictyostelium purpureum]|uniref:SAM domain-containing protein n=1 Tax=Dictyostelium purpureum TaxID=5786 RepID=F1A1K4_DICPU|nr:uncharacterized protein DICPUDRAFT_158419 [Dictyostelium purpureum]EGC29929.1 hypothetical protein DICPUDRAFT_158419 [Dictyostelium purpureum]|eukprot:XP_003293551.1 hypothetical protein DICPUDRAFT_158419 [Dictyostelium purpureum]
MWRVEQSSNEPSPRCAHQSESIGDHLYVFGGWNDDNQMLNDIFKFNVNTWEWEEIKVIDNSFITPRNGHSLNSYNRKLIVFGGGSFSGFLNDINIFDPIKLQWTLVNTTGDIPSGRSKHSSTLIFNKLYIFGGGDGIRLYNDMFCLDLETFEWKKIIYNNSSGEAIQPPSARWGHTMVSLGDNKHMVLFAGHAGTKRINDLYLFNIESNEWLTVNFDKDSDATPLPRAGHSTLMVDHHMVIFGGGDGHIINDLYGLDTKCWRWWKIKINNTPDARCAHSATIIKNKLLIFGGGNGIQCFKKLLILENLDQLDNIYQNRNQEPIINNSNNNNNNNNNNINQPTLSSSPPQPSVNNILKINKNFDHIKKSISQISANIEFKSKNIENNNHTVLPQFPSFKEHNSSNSNINNKINKSNKISINNEIRKDLKNSCLTEYQRREEEIDTTVFHLLTEDHLKEIGIKSLGERLLIIKGIKESTLYILKGLPPISTDLDPGKTPKFVDEI